MPLPLLAGLGIGAGVAARGALVATIGRIGAIFGIGLALREVRKTAEVVPQTAGVIGSLALPLTLGAAAFFVFALKKRK